MSFRGPELSTMFPAKSQKTYENAWFSPHFEESEEKRAKACMKNTRTTARAQKRQKRNKTRGLRHMFEERASKTIKKRHGTAAPRPDKRVKTRGFRNIFEKTNKNTTNVGLIRKS